MGFSDLPDFSQMAAITFCDVVVSHVPFTDGLLFHELVHVEQYRQLGVRRFSELYVRGFLSGGCYDGIPLEVNAYAVGRRFERTLGSPSPWPMKWRDGPGGKVWSLLEVRSVSVPPRLDGMYATGPAGTTGGLYSSLCALPGSFRFRGLGNS